MNTSILLGFLGGWELILAVLVILILFGGRRIPELMRGLGLGITEFKKARELDSTDNKKDDKNSEQ